MEPMRVMNSRQYPHLSHEFTLLGLVNALKLLQPIKDKYSSVIYADLFQLAGDTAIEEAGGPKIPMKYGRIDVTGPEQRPEEGRLPDAGPPSPANHLREVFYRMGLNDKIGFTFLEEIVALSVAHTLEDPGQIEADGGSRKLSILKTDLGYLVDNPGLWNG